MFGRVFAEWDCGEADPDQLMQKMALLQSPTREVPSGSEQSVCSFSLAAAYCRRVVHVFFSCIMASADPAMQARLADLKSKIAEQMIRIQNEPLPCLLEPLGESAGPEKVKDAMSRAQEKNHPFSSSSLKEHAPHLTEQLDGQSTHAAEPAEQNKFVVKTTGRMWQITTEILRQLLDSGRWISAPSNQADPLYHLLLGDRGRVQYTHLVGRKVPPTTFVNSSSWHAAAQQRVLVNSYRGCNDLTNKSALCKTMRHWALEHGLSASQLEYLPSTFVLRPGDQNDERKLFLAEFARQQALLIHPASTSSSTSTPSTSTPLATERKNAWIAKANRGAKGDAIFVSDDAEKLIAYVDARAGEVQTEQGGTKEEAAAPSSCSVNASNDPVSTTPSSTLAARAPPLRSRFAQHSRTTSLAAAASNSWVLQRYIDRPFLLSGRKFDMRCWAVVDAQYRVWMYRNGVCRTSSTPYSLADLSDTFVHLTNHCIQAQHPEFAKAEEGNEIFFDGLQAYLDALPSSELHSRLCVVCHLLPQLQRVVVDTLTSVRASMQGTGEYDSFQLFGYDFMVDDKFEVKLLEINATPASAEKLLQPLVQHLIERAIQPIFGGADQPRSFIPAISSLTHRSITAASILSHPCDCSGLLQGLTKQEYLTTSEENLFDRIA